MPPRMPFITPGTSKTTILNGLVLKKIVQQSSVLNTALGGAVSDVVTVNHYGQNDVDSGAATTEGTISDIGPPFDPSGKNKVKLFYAATKNTIEYDPGTGAREVFGRLSRPMFIDYFDYIPLNSHPYWQTNSHGWNYISFGVGCIPTISNAQQVSGTQSCLLPNGGVLGDQNAIFCGPIAPFTTQVLQFYVYFDSLNGHFRMYTDSGPWGPHTQADLYGPSLLGTGNWAYNNAGAFVDSGVPVVIATWLLVTITHNHIANTYSAWVDDGGGPVAICVGAAFWGVPPTPNCTNIIFSTQWGASGAPMMVWLDDVMVDDWKLYYYYMSDLGVETAYAIPADNYDYWYPIRTNLRDVAEDFAVSDVKELPIDMDKYSPDYIVALDSSGTHTTIASALAACAGGETVYVKDGAYGETVAISVAMTLVMSPGATTTQITTSIANVKIFGGTITTLVLGANTCRVSGSIITTLTAGVARTDITLDYCNISTLGASGHQTGWIVVGCTINTVTGMFPDFYNSIISSNYFIGGGGLWEFGTLFCTRLVDNRFGGSFRIQSLNGGNILSGNIGDDACTMTITNFNTGLLLRPPNTISNNAFDTIIISDIADSSNKVNVIGNACDAITLSAFSGAATSSAYFAFNSCVPSLPGVPVSENLIAVYNGNLMNPFPKYTANPASSTEGDIWYNSTDHEVKIYDGTRIRGWGIAQYDFLWCDDAAAASGQIARFTANGIEGITNADVKTQLGYMTDLVDDTTPQLGGDLDLNGKSIEFDPTPTDDTCHGDIITATAGENVILGDLCYYKLADGRFWKTDADAEVTADGFLVLAAATINAGNTGKFLLRGFIKDASRWNWSVAAETSHKLYIDTATAGDMTQTAPSVAGDIVRIVGYVLDADSLFFDPDQSYLEVA